MRCFKNHLFAAAAAAGILFTAALAMLLMPGCRDNPEYDKYKMSKIEENIYSFTGVQDVALMDDVIYCANNDKIYTSSFDNVNESNEFCTASSEMRMPATFVRRLLSMILCHVQ